VSVLVTEAEAATARPDPAGMRSSLIGIERAALTGLMAELGADQPGLRARQLEHWLYQRGVADIAAMTTLPAALRARLAERCTAARPAISAAQVSADGTRKWLLRFADGQEVETVFIPEDDRGALCISTQVGCTLTCAFCHTGTMPLVRNLGAGEILAQLLLARDALGEWPSTRAQLRRHRACAASGG
jgi:23S rRNA (adenine2503-C2)-methyltransferase